MPKLPEVHLQYLVDYLNDEVGWASQGALGPTPLSHQELQAWQRNMQRPLQPWELDFMRRLSQAYCAELSAAQDPDAPPPWADETVSEQELTNVAGNLRATLRGMAA